MPGRRKSWEQRCLHRVRQRVKPLREISQNDFRTEQLPAGLSDLWLCILVKSVANLEIQNNEWEKKGGLQEGGGNHWLAGLVLITVWSKNVEPPQQKPFKCTPVLFQLRLEPEPRAVVLINKPWEWNICTNTAVGKSPAPSAQVSSFDTWNYFNTTENFHSHACKSARSVLQTQDN